MIPAISTVAFDGYPMEVALDEIAALGTGRVEPAYIEGYTDFDEDSFSDAAAARLGRTLASLGLRAPSLSAHLNLALDGADARLMRRIAFAEGVGAPILITNAGPRTGRDAILARLDAAIPALEHGGVTLALENPGHGSGDLIGRGADGAALVAALDHPRIRLNVDLGNYRTYAGALDPDLADALPYAAHAHLKDIAANGPHWRFVALGDGLVDWDAAAATLDRLAPGLPTAIELPLRLSRPFRGDPERGTAPLPLPRIRKTLRRSVATWTRATTGGPPGRPR